MNLQKRLEREVAEITGETISEIQRRGFGPADVIRTADPEPDDTPRFIDWDQLDLVRNVALVEQSLTSQA